MHRTNTQLRYQFPNRHLPKPGQCRQVLEPIYVQLLTFFDQLKQLLVFWVAKRLLPAFLVEAPKPLNLRHGKSFIYLLQQPSFFRRGVCPAGPQGNYVGDERIQRPIIQTLGFAKQGMSLQRHLGGGECSTPTNVSKCA